MQQWILGGVAVALLAVSTPCEAARRMNRQVVTQQGSIQQGAQQPGFFARLMEMERRKNERLREIFFGR